jgi:outer membrane lipoprotein-sorting protein
MFGSLLLMFCPICADPVAGAPAVVAKLVSPDEHHVAAKVRPAPPGDVELLLRRWESASHRQTERSESKRELLRRDIARDVNQHAALAVEQLTGRVDADRLKTAFIWSIVDKTDGRVCLEATPAEETDQLFYGAIRLWLDDQTGCVERLQLIDRRGVVRTSWTGEAPETQPALALTENASSTVLTDDGIPPSPVVLTANVPAQVASLETPVARILTLTSATEADPTGLSNFTPEVAEILSKWESASQSMKTAKVRFKRFVYNLVFHVEKRSEGELFYEAPNRLCVVLHPTRVEENEKSRRTDKNGNAFQVESDRAESWIWTGDAVICANDEEKTYEVVPLPQEANLRYGWPLPSFQDLAPFLFNIRADQIRREWTITLNKRDGNRVVLAATPRTERLKQRFGRCLITLDQRDWRIVAVKCMDATGNLETVYSAEAWQVNPPPFADEVFLPI